jgi:hypothetical protein
MAPMTASPYSVAERRREAKCRSTLDIELALAHVARTERVIRKAQLRGDRLFLEMQFRSPCYTTRPVRYLNSSILAVALAQAGHLFVDSLALNNVDGLGDVVSESIILEARRAHRFYFVDLRMRFRQPWPDQDYPLVLSKTWTRVKHSSILAHFSFTAGSADHASGYFVGALCLSDPESEQ